MWTHKRNVAVRISIVLALLATWTLLLAIHPGVGRGVMAEEAGRKEKKKSGIIMGDIVGAMRHPSGATPRKLKVKSGKRPGQAGWPAKTD